MYLPEKLKNALDKELESKSLKKIAFMAEDLSKRYRGGRFSGRKYVETDDEVEAYIAFRLPATYSAVYSVLNQINERCPKLKHETLLDAGAGPGTAMWAAAEIWPDIKKVTLLEREDKMISAGKRLAAYSESASVKNAEWIKADITDDVGNTAYDAVIASYALSELPDERRMQVIQKLWDITKEMLIIIEPGTPAGFDLIKKAREFLLSYGAKTAAPCPHDEQCPVNEKDWCHFSQRVSRSRIHRMAKQGDLSYEDEKFSYVCMSRSGGFPLTARVLRHPQIHSGHIAFKLCTPDGLKDAVVTRKDKKLYKLARDLNWGSEFPINCEYKDNKV